MAFSTRSTTSYRYLFFPFFSSSSFASLFTFALSVVSLVALPI